jgi:hypothetical protein
MRSATLSHKWISISFLTLILGYFAFVSSVDAQGSIECNHQPFPPVDCPPLSPSEEETINDDDDDSGNIEEQIPSVIPFP